VLRHGLVERHDRNPVAERFDPPASSRWFRGCGSELRPDEELGENDRRHHDHVRFEAGQGLLWRPSCPLEVDDRACVD
jgi:hypothetical protein